MESVLIFSGSLRKLVAIIKFYSIKSWNIFVLIFKWNKEIQPIQLSYFRDWRLEKSYLIIHFNFKNAVWYQLQSIKKIDCSKPIILNLENIKESKLELIVYGLFRKKIYIIDTTKNKTITTNSFKTTISNINIVEQIISNLMLKLQKPFFKNEEISLKLNEIETAINPIHLTFNNFTQKEFI